MRRLPALAVLILSAAAFAACDSGEDAQREGSYRAELTGDVEQTFEGPAFFSSFSIPIPEFEDFLNVTLIGPGGRSFFGLGFDGRPEPGTYVVGSEGTREGTVLFVDQDQSLQLSGVSGSITITRSTEQRIEGTFQADLSEAFATDEGGTTVRASGSFDATLQVVPVPFVPTRPMASSFQD